MEFSYRLNIYMCVVAVLVFAVSATVDKEKCEWRNVTRKNFIEEPPFIDVNINDVNYCLTRCLNTIPNCFSVRYSKFERSCRYSGKEYGHVDLENNPKVDSFMLECPGIFPIKTEYIALIGLGGLALLLVITNVVIVCVLSGRK